MKYCESEGVTESSPAANAAGDDTELDLEGTRGAWILDGPVSSPASGAAMTNGSVADSLETTMIGTVNSVAWAGGVTGPSDAASDWGSSRSRRSTSELGKITGGSSGEADALVSSSAVRTSVGSSWLGGEIMTMLPSRSSGEKNSQLSVDVTPQKIRLKRTCLSDCRRITLCLYSALTGVSRSRQRLGVAEPA